jgi:hypothetical protein
MSRKIQVFPDMTPCGWVYSYPHFSADDRGGRAVYGVGLRPLACWDFGFKSRRGHGCLSCIATKPLEWFISIWIKFKGHFFIIYSRKKDSSVNLRRRFDIGIIKVCMPTDTTNTQTAPNPKTARCSFIQICSHQSTEHSYRLISIAAVLIALLRQPALRSDGNSIILLRSLSRTRRRCPLFIGN